nr:unnamed protein product [Digitaria exilis]
MDTAAEDIVIAGAGLAGLAVALGLHSVTCFTRRRRRNLVAASIRKGVRSLVLESSPFLRASGFAFTTWKNAFRALDALGIGDKIRKQHLQAQTYVLIGCDGINSVVAKWLGLAKPSYSGRSAARGFAHYPDGHGFDPTFLQFTGNGFRAGMMPCNENDIYWFFTWTPSDNDKGVDENASKMKQFVLDKFRGSKNVPEEALAVIDKSEMSDVLAAPLRFRPPLSLITASISKGNVCVAGDALHPMTPDLGQGGCAALEDGVVLARCLGEALAGEDAGENERIEAALREYARIRRWRSVELIATAYTLGIIQQSDNGIISFLRDKFLSGALAGRLLKMADYDCGTLSN